MTVVPLTSMPSASPLTGSEIFYLQQSAADAQATISQITAMTGASIQTGQANATSTTSGTTVMMGFGGATWGTPSVITPKRTGIVVFGVYGNLLNTGAFTTFAVIQYGTGTAPVNGAAVTGTNIAGSIAGLGNLGPPFSMYAPATGLALGTAYWFDVGLQVTGGTGSVTNIKMVAFEL